MKVLKIKNLPVLTEDLTDAVIDAVAKNKNTRYSDGFNYNFDNLFQDRPENIGYGYPIKQTEQLTEQAKLLFQDYFSVPIEFSITYFLPRKPDDLYCIPAHSHKFRTLAINFYLDLGNDQAQTVFYKRIDSGSSDPIEKWANFYFKEDLDPYGYFVATNREWYTFPTWIPHSIENITSNRIIFTIETPPLYDMVDLVHEAKLEFEQVPLIMA